MSTPAALLVITNLPDRAAAEKLADALIGGGLAACVNILSPCSSVYRWKGEVQRDQEFRMVVSLGNRKLMNQQPSPCISALTQSFPISSRRIEKLHVSFRQLEFPSHYYTSPSV